MKQSEITIEDIHEYLMGWYDSDSLRDFNMALDSGFTLLAANMLKEAGAFDNPDLSYEPEMEHAILKELKKYGKRNLGKDFKECFNSAVVYVNPETNEHAFVSNGHVDYLLTPSEMKNWGYITEQEYYNETK